MPTIHVEFPEELAYESLTTLDLKSNNPRHVNGVVQITRQLHRNSHSVVYMGQMTENPKPLALKFAYGKDLMRDLRKEAKIYDERLEPVQGSAVPNFFGLYKTKIPVKDRFVRIVGCLLLEYCGESVGLFEYLEVPTRALLLKKLRDIHLCGIMHGDFAERNVVMQGDDIRIIDFHHASRHKCGVKMEVAESRRIPKTSDFGCVDLWIHCYDMYIWRNWVIIGDLTCSLDDYPPQPIVNKHIPKDIYYYDEKGAAIMLKYFRDLKVILDSGTVPEDQIEYGLVSVAGQSRLAVDYPPKDFMDFVVGEERLTNTVIMKEFDEYFLEVKAKLDSGEWSQANLERIMEQVAQERALYDPDDPPEPYVPRFDA